MSTAVPCGWLGLGETEQQVQVRLDKCVVTWTPVKCSLLQESFRLIPGHWGACRDHHWSPSDLKLLVHSERCCVLWLFKYHA